MKEEYLRRAGKRVKELRDELGLSTRGFGKKIGFSNSYVSNIENGKKLPTMNVLTKISEVFDVDLAYFLLDETDEPISEDKEWYLFGKELEKEGITLEDVKVWVEIAKATKNKKA